AAIEPQFYRSFCQALEQAGAMSSSRAKELLARQWDRTDWPAAREKLAAAFLERTRDDWNALFAGHDACVAPVLSLEEAQRHPHNVARASFANCAGIPQPAPTPRFSATRGQVGSSPDRPAVEIDAVLRRWE